MEKEPIRGSNTIGIVGTNNTGKTVIAEEIIKRFNKKRDNINLKDYPTNFFRLVVFDPQDRFGEYLKEGDISLHAGTKNWEKKIVGLRDSLIVFDDLKQILREDRLSDDFLDILGLRAEYGLDLIFIVWQSKLLPPRITPFIDKYYLFKSHEDEKEYVSRINGVKKDIINAKRLLDIEFSKTDKFEYAKLYPHFPFISYDLSQNTMKKINFSKK